MNIVAIFIILLLSLCNMNDVRSASLTIGTWNTFDVYYGGSRDARRNYFFENAQSLFGDLDAFCTQESHTYASITDFTDNLSDIFPFSYYFNESSSSDELQACLQSEISAFTNETSAIYACNEACTDSLPSSLGYIFCLWRCFGELRDNITGITTRANNENLFDLGAYLEVGSCLTCLWKSYFVESLGSQWTAAGDNYTTDAMFDDILDLCVSASNTFDYKPNQGMILWSKYEFDSVEYVELDEALFIPRGYIKATISNESIIGNSGSGSFTIVCTHLETPTINNYFAPHFATTKQANIDKSVTELSNITQNQVAQLVNDINNMEGGVLLLGDLNIGINSRVDLYNELLSGAGLENVFGTNDELIAALNCSRCKTNPFTSNQEIVDHILIKGDYAIDSAERFMDSMYNTTDGIIPLSDHYGIKTTLIFPWNKYITICSSIHNNTCFVNCNDTDCVGHQIQIENISNITNINVLCSSYSCSHTTVQCSAGINCNIECYGKLACSDMLINAEDTLSLFVGCYADGRDTPLGATYFWPFTRYGHSLTSCSNMVIYSNSKSNPTIMCESDYCFRMQLHSPNGLADWNLLFNSCMTKNRCIEDLKDQRIALFCDEVANTAIYFNGNDCNRSAQCGCIEDVIQQSFTCTHNIDECSFMIDKYVEFVATAVYLLDYTLSLSIIHCLLIIYPFIRLCLCYRREKHHAQYCDVIVWLQLSDLCIMITFCYFLCNVVVLFYDFRDYCDQYSNVDRDICRNDDLCDVWYSGEVPRDVAGHSGESIGYEGESSDYCYYDDYGWNRFCDYKDYECRPKKSLYLMYVWMIVFTAFFSLFDIVKIVVITLRIFCEDDDELTDGEIHMTSDSFAQLICIWIACNTELKQKLIRKYYWRKRFFIFSHHNDISSFIYLIFNFLRNIRL